MTRGKHGTGAVVLLREGAEHAPKGMSGRKIDVALRRPAIEHSGWGPVRCGMRPLVLLTDELGVEDGGKM
jgi:hypothetical protein